MKALMVAVFMGALLLAAAYYLCGFHTFDATQQGKDARASIGPGMTWEQVFDLIGDPREYQPIMKTTKRFGPDSYDIFKPGPRNKFSRKGVSARLEEDSLPNGFLCTFTYSSSEAFTIHFDGTGTVTGVADAITMADLLQYDRD